MSSQSNVGDSKAYGNDDQRRDTDPVNDRDRFHEGEKNSHQANDPKDERSIANRLDKETREDDNSSGKKLSKEDKLAQKDPTAPARLHGNEPSKGAKIDAQIQAEEEEELRRKGKLN